MKKLKLALYLSAHAFALETLEESEKQIEAKLKERFSTEGHAALDFDYWNDRVRELRGKFQNLATQQTESEIADANKAAADKKAAASVAPKK